MYEKYQIIQDMLVPMKDLGRSLDVFDKELEVVTNCLLVIQNTVEDICRQILCA